MNVLMFPYVNLIPVIARDVLHVGPGLMGLLQSAAGLGAAVGGGIDSVVGGPSIPRPRLSWRSLVGMSRAALVLVLRVVRLVVSSASAGRTGHRRLFDDAEHDRDAHRGPGHARQGRWGVINESRSATAPLGAFALGLMAERIDVQFAIGANATLGAVLLGLIALMSPSLRRPFRARR